MTSTDTSACSRRSPTSWPRRCPSGPSRSARSPSTSPTSSARRWTARTRRPPRSRPAASRCAGGREGAESRGDLVVPLQAGSSSAQQLSRPLLRCGPVPIAEELSRTLATSAARRASPPTPLRRPRSEAGVAPPSRPASGRSRSGTRRIPALVYDPELFRRDILPRLATVKLIDIAEAAGCSQGVRVRHQAGKWTPHVSTWAALAGLVNRED